LQGGWKKNASEHRIIVDFHCGDVLAALRLALLCCVHVYLIYGFLPSDIVGSFSGREVGDVIAQPSEDEDDDAQQAEGEEGGEGVEGEEGTDATDPVPVEEEEEEEEEDEEQAKQLAKIKKFDVWEFHGVMYLALVAFRVDGHFKGSDSGEGKGKRKGKKGKKK